MGVVLEKELYLFRGLLVSGAMFAGVIGYKNYNAGFRVDSEVRPVFSLGYKF
jgi:hypothetical protein